MFAMDTGPGVCLEHFKWGGQSGALAQKRVAGGGGVMVCGTMYVKIHRVYTH